jgi:hypothetical protein
MADADRPECTKRGNPELETCLTTRTLVFSGLSEEGSCEELASRMGNIKKMNRKAARCYEKQGCMALHARSRCADHCFDEAMQCAGVSDPSAGKCSRKSCETARNACMAGCGPLVGDEPRD